ncbi:MAG: peroxiredoxin family protein [Terriglobales bacterium]
MVNLPNVRDMAPDFVLPSSTGKEYRLSDFRGRRDLVLIFAARGEATSPLLQALAARANEVEDEEALVLVIVRGDMVTAEAVRKRDGFPFPVLADQDGQVHQRYGAEHAKLYITDRYGEIYSIHNALPPSADEVLASLRHINAACPECEAPVWWA